MPGMRGCLEGEVINTASFAHFGHEGKPRFGLCDVPRGGTPCCFALIKAGSVYCLMRWSTVCILLTLMQED